MMHELPDMETAGDGRTDTMPTHTTIDHIDDALHRLARAQNHCAAVEAKYLRMADENAKLRARVAELDEQLAGAKLAFQMVSRRPLTDAEKALADDIEIEPETVAMMKEQETTP